MTSKNQKKRGYLLPENLEPTEYVCLTLRVPNEDKYLRAIRGAVQELGYWWNWEKSYTEGDTRAKTAAEVWRKTIYETYMIGECEVCCCDDIKIIKQNIQNIRTTQMFNAPQTADYYTNYTSLITTYNASSDPIADIAPDFDTPSGATDSALCQAISEFIAQSCQIIIEARQRDEFFIGLGAIILTVGAAFVTAGSSLALGLALGTAGAGLAGLLAGLSIAVLEDTSARNELKCLMYSRIVGDVPTLSNWSVLLDSTTGLSTNAELIRNALQPIMTNTDVYAGFLQRLNELFPLATAGLLEQCDECAPAPVLKNLRGYGRAYFINGVGPTVMNPAIDGFYDFSCYVGDEVTLVCNTNTVAVGDCAGGLTDFTATITYLSLGSGGATIRYGTGCSSLGAWTVGGTYTNEQLNATGLSAMGFTVDA